MRLFGVEEEARLLMRPSSFALSLILTAGGGVSTGAMDAGVQKKVRNIRLGFEFKCRITFFGRCLSLYRQREGG